MCFNGGTQLTRGTAGTTTAKSVMLVSVGSSFIGASTHVDMSSKDPRCVFVSTLCSRPLSTRVHSCATVIEVRVQAVGVHACRCVAQWMRALAVHSRVDLPSRHLRETAPRAGATSPFRPPSPRRPRRGSDLRALLALGGVAGAEAERGGRSAGGTSFARGFRPNAQSAIRGANHSTSHVDSSCRQSMVSFMSRTTSVQLMSLVVLDETETSKAQPA
jgi:hypothetical protein